MFEPLKAAEKIKGTYSHDDLPILRKKMEDLRAEYLRDLVEVSVSDLFRMFREHGCLIDEKEGAMTIDPDCRQIESRLRCGSPDLAQICNEVRDICENYGQPSINGRVEMAYKKVITLFGGSAKLDVSTEYVGKSAYVIIVND